MPLSERSTLIGLWMTQCCWRRSFEELESICERLLAGELKSPGFICVSDVGFVRNLTMERLKNIERTQPNLQNQLNKDSRA